MTRPAIHRPPASARRLTWPMKKHGPLACGEAENWAEEQLDFKTITYRVADSVAHLTLSRPARTNALNGRMLQEINGAMDLAERDTAVRVVVVAGAGQAFSSGFDLKEQIELRPTGFDQWKPILRKDFDVI